MEDLLRENIGRIQQCIEEAEFVLIGVGEEFREKPGEREKLLKAYGHLAGWLNGKTYFIVTENQDELIFETELLEFFVAAPFLESRRMQGSQEQWNSYLNWLAATLNHKLCILELGVGFSSPQLIRWPFEKTAQFNFKSTFIRVNEKLPQLPEEIADRGISVPVNAVELLCEADREENA